MTADPYRPLPGDEHLPSISIIFPTYNRCDVVETTLEHLLAQDYPADRFEILVCDNSSDGTPAMVERVASTARVPVILQSSDERLPAVKRNQGLRAATGELALFLNDDVWVVPTFLREHAAAHAAAGRTVAVLGKVAQSPSMPQTPFISWYEPFAYDQIADRDGRSVPWYFNWSMNLSLPRQEMLDRNLIFHEDWANIGHEDVELGWRWTRAGNEIVYCAAAFGEHYHPHGLTSACGVQQAIGRGVRDLEVLVPDPTLLERYGIFSLESSRRAIVRGAVRQALFNRWTTPRLRTWLEAQDHNTRLMTWMYWKVLLHYTNVGYREQGPRDPRPTPTFPRPVEATTRPGVDLTTDDRVEATAS